MRPRGAAVLYRSRRYTNRQGTKFEATKV